MSGWEARLPEAGVARRRPRRKPLFPGRFEAAGCAAGANPTSHPRARCAGGGTGGGPAGFPPRPRDGTTPPGRRALAALRMRDLGLSAELPEATRRTLAPDSETPLGLLSLATFRLSTGPFARFLDVGVAVLITCVLRFPAGPGEAERTCGGP